MTFDVSTRGDSATTVPEDAFVVATRPVGAAGGFVTLSKFIEFGGGGGGRVTTGGGNVGAGGGGVACARVATSVCAFEVGGAAAGAPKGAGGVAVPAAWREPGVGADVFASPDGGEETGGCGGAIRV